MYLYGSQARNRARPDSDIDLAVLLDDRRLWTPVQRTYSLDELGARVVKALGIERDLVDVQDLERMPVTVAIDVVALGQCLYEAEPKLDVCYRAQVCSQYQDFEPIERMFRRALHRRLAEGTFGR